MYQIFRDYMNEATTLVTAAAMIVCIVGVIGTYNKTRSLVPTIGAVILGAIVMFGVTRFDEIGNEIDADIDQRQRRVGFPTESDNGE